MVAIKEISRVLVMLEVTCWSLIASKRSGAFTERNIPTKGAMRKRRSTPPRKMKIIRVLL